MTKSTEIECGKKIEFKNIEKTFEYIDRLGEGGTGDTHLLKDNTTDMYFAFKKYVPKEEEYREEYYIRFVEEIKILFNISHPNIVRIYNYYLYPKLETGYLQMEYVKGVTINKYIPSTNQEWNSIFLQTINAFKYLESMGILHRDIRENNILITSDGQVKIIDFGFGKKITANSSDNSIILNWPVSKFPEEVTLKDEYKNYTEIYFLGKLFEYILKEKEINNSDFKYFDIIKKMTEYQVVNRYNSFEELSNDIATNKFSELEFTEDEKRIYQNFSNVLHDKIIKYKNEYEPITDFETIIEKLAIVLRKNSLEEKIQNNADLIKCFITNGFSYNTVIDINKDILEKFYNWIISLDVFKINIVIDNINNKLSNIKVEEIDLPF